VPELELPCAYTGAYTQSICSFTCPLQRINNDQRWAGERSMNPFASKVEQD
jgi:hypothetical protein